eukprot:5504668-Pyramimonas_sp.AAC.1
MTSHHYIPKIPTHLAIVSGWAGGDTRSVNNWARWSREEKGEVEAKEGGQEEEREGGHPPLLPRRRQM